MNHFSVDIRPLTESCSLALERKDHICFGISPFNSQFSQEYLDSLVKFGLTHFKSFHLFLPDEPTIYTLEALGYSPSEARRKMKKQINWLRNKMLKALETNGLSSEKNSYILDWESLNRNKSFKEELEEAFQFFDTDEEFRNECMEASKWVLQNKMQEENLTEASLLKAVKYFLSEIPLFAATNKIVQTSSSLFCYHQHIMFHEKLYRNFLSYEPAFGQGYGVISINHSSS